MIFKIAMSSILTFIICTVMVKIISSFEESTGNELPKWFGNTFCIFWAISVAVAIGCLYAKLWL